MLKYTSFISRRKISHGKTKHYHFTLKFFFCFSFFSQVTGKVIGIVNKKVLNCVSIVRRAELVTRNANKKLTISSSRTYKKVANSTDDLNLDFARLYFVLKVRVEWEKLAT